MNAESFAEYLKNPSQLYQLSYQELKTLVMQYPFCQNLHLLLLQKSKLDDHKELPANLERAAAYSSNRHFLYQLMQENGHSAIKKDHVILREDYLELKDLSKVEENPEKAVLEREEAPREVDEEMRQQLQHLSSETSEMANNPFLNSSGKDYEDVNLSETLINDLQEDNDEAETAEFEWSIEGREGDPVDEDPERAPLELTETPEAIDKTAGETPFEESAVQDVPQASEPATPFQVTKNIIQLISSCAEVLDRLNYFRPEEMGEAAKPESGAPPPLSEATSSVATSPKPRPKSSFSSWIQEFQPSHIRNQLDELMETKKLEELKKARKKKKKKKKNKISLIAEKSLANHQELASRTLAQILVNQQQYHKAIAMYNRLIFLYPEEKSYFEARIAEIRQLIEP